MVHDCDVLVIGAGAAATRAALEAANPGVTVILVDKGECGRSGTSPLALHGLATTLHEGDSEERLLQDIVHAGGDLSDHDLVREAAREAGKEPALLEAIGVHFHRLDDGKYHIYRGDGHSVPHGLSFDAEENGLNVVSVLANEAWKRGVVLVEKVMITDLLVDDGRIFGAFGIDEAGADHVFAAGAVVLAAGGANRIFPNVVPRIADEKYRTTGDALVLALRAGLNLIDMEMANFRNSPPASRLGARYINANGDAFMAKYDPLGEHAPRGKVVEALYREMQAGNGPIYMEITPESERVAAFSAQEYKDYVKAYKEGKRPPVTITFQRLLGGARISDDTSCSIRGLYIAGESAGGFHGGDRLQGAAFLETQVFGRIAGTAAAEFARGLSRDGRVGPLASAASRRLRTRMGAASNGAAVDVVRRVQHITWSYASIVKSGDGLRTALQGIDKVKQSVRQGLVSNNAFAAIEAENLALTAEAIIRASLQRDETRATHHRSDFPHAKDALQRKHTSVRLADGEMVAEFIPCRD